MYTLELRTKTKNDSAPHHTIGQIREIGMGVAIQMAASLVPISPVDGNSQPHRREAQFASPLAIAD
jgi:hypothetical protein